MLDVLDSGYRTLQTLPTSEDPTLARGWVGDLGGGVEGVVAKPADRPYLPRYGSGWTKWRRRHTTDAVVVGITGTTPEQQAAVIAQPDARGRLRPVGVTLPLGTRLRAELAPLLRPAGEGLAELPGTVAGLPGQPSFLYQPVLPDVILEIETAQATPTEFGRFRHRPRPVRARADLTADQLQQH